MRTLPLLTATAAAALLLGLAGCSAAADTTAAMHDGTSAGSSSSTATRTGTFDGLNDKKVSGSVTVSGSSIRLTGFSSDEGPDLHVYLASGTTEDAVTSGTEIDALKFDTASQTFTIPSGVDAASYDYVVIHCDKAKAVFGAAQLSK